MQFTDKQLSLNVTQLTQLSIPEISRFHAQINVYIVGRQLDSHLSSGKSENGTFHQGTRLPPGVSHRLEDFDHVAFGPLEFRYLGPEQLTLFCKAVKGGTILL